MPIQSTSEGKISLAKGIIFTKIGLANGYIFKLWAAPPYPKFSREPPPPCMAVITCKVFVSKNVQKDKVKGTVLFTMHLFSQLSARFQKHPTEVKFRRSLRTPAVSIFGDELASMTFIAMSCFP